MTVERQGPYQLSGKNMVKNIYIFSGAENTLKISRVYSTKWLCDYHMLWFPFDTQVQENQWRAIFRLFPSFSELFVTVDTFCLFSEISGTESRAATIFGTYRADTILCERVFYEEGS